MNRGTIVALVVAATVVGGGAYIANRLAQGGKVTEVGVDRAIEDFRAQVPEREASPVTAVGPADELPAPSTTVVAPPRSLPAIGVYSYETSGYDEVDVLTGARHDYPDITTITVIPSDCGVEVRWDVAEERWDSAQWCLDGDGIELVGWTGYHEFFGVAGVKEYTCAGDPRPFEAPSGTTWEIVCRIGDTDETRFRGTVLGTTPLTIGSAPVEALHLRYDIDVLGESIGTHTIEGWYRIADGLPLRETVSVSTRQSTVIGSTTFEERSTIELISLQPAG